MTNESKELPKDNLNWLLSTMDAKLWADEYCKLNSTADHGAILAWFACAIMTGYDEANRRAKAIQPAGDAAWWVRELVNLSTNSNLTLEARRACHVAADLAIPAAPVQHDASATLATLRAQGLSVAVHNDYRLNGEAHTFWLFTGPDGMSYKGEGKTDAEALAQVSAALASEAKADAAPVVSANSVQWRYDNVQGKDGYETRVAVPVEAASPPATVSNTTAGASEDEFGEVERSVILEVLRTHRMVRTFEMEEDGPGNSYPLIDRLALNDGADIESGIVEIEALADAIADQLWRARRPAVGMVAAPTVNYAQELATSLWRAHYSKEAPHWKVHADLVGILSQIDNMTAGMVRRPAAPDMSVRDAITEYYNDLDARKHGGVAMDKAFNKIQQAMNMTWEDHKLNKKE